MAQSQSVDGAIKESFSDTGLEASIAITLSGTPGVTTKFTFPDDCKGFRLLPISNNIRFSVGTFRESVGQRTVAAIATSSAADIAASALSNGGIALADVFETRLLPPYDGKNKRSITLVSLSASTVVNLEVF